MTAHRSFRRSFGSLEEIFAFTADFFARHGVEPALLPTVDFTLEELFRGKTAPQWRAAYAGAYDWGADVGREAIEE